MKKLLSLFLSLTMCLLLFGCSGIPSLPTEQSDAGGNTAPAVTVPSETEPSGSDAQDAELLPEEAGQGQIMIKIDNSNMEYYYAPDGSGQLILSYICEKPSVEIEGNDYASDTINNFFNDLDEEYYTGENRGRGNVFGPGFNLMLQKAYDNFQKSIDYKIDIRLDLVFSHYVDVVRCDNRVISFVFTDYLFEGSGSGEYYKYALSFDTFSGEIIDITEGRDATRIRRTVNRNVAEFEELSYDKGCWYLDNDGLSFLVRNEEDGSGSSYKTVTVPYSAFNGVEAAYMSVTGKYRTGSVSIDDHVPANSTLPILDRIDADPEGQDCFLTVEGTVYDFKLINVQYSNYEEIFYSKDMYWMTNYISDSIIQLALDIPDGMPNMMVSYKSDGIEYNRFITQSGKDGTLLLLDDDITAVG